MKTNVSRLSLDAYRAFDPLHLERMEQEIIELFKLSIVYGGRELAISRQQLAEVKQLGINTVTGRVKSLLDKRLLAEEGERIDPKTRRKQALLVLARKH